MPLPLITYGDKTDLNAVTEILKQVAASDLNEIKAVVNAIVAELNTGAAAQTVFLVSLPSAGSVAARIAAAIEGTDYPTGWVLTVGASAVDINIAHGLARRVASVTIFAETAVANEEQQLFNTAAYNGIKTIDVNNLLINSLATILKRIFIYIVFE